MMLLTHLNALRRRLYYWLDCLTDKERKQFIDELEKAKSDLDDV